MLSNSDVHNSIVDLNNLETSSTHALYVPLVSPQTTTACDTQKQTLSATNKDKRRQANSNGHALDKGRYNFLQPVLNEKNPNNLQP